ncbi:HepT-like ribonuclease domain-containing protein [Tomitella gaofuii]|uniref:HepT-like ribonuclease domain-containing protein n=1 Tax=Tomitella gaofuii TaxID=2760083 RepID=UPI0015FE1387|nr:HepT-like ribonuclease domain-containing protein [Tomitella gaofuii]
MKSPRPYLQMVVAAASRVAEHLPASEDEFLRTQLVQDAVCMRLQEMGENLGKIRRQFPSFYADNGSERWQRLIGLRNVISRGYGELDMHVVWQIASVHLDPLTEDLRALLDPP